MVHNILNSTNSFGLMVPKKPVLNRSNKSIVDAISAIYYQLSTAKDLKPNPNINSLFADLVKLCASPYDEETSSSVLKEIKPFLSNIRLLASEGEYHLELYWAHYLASQPKVDLSQFVYYDNYLELVRLELHTLRGVGATLDRLVFVGSGPLPLSSIMLYQLLEGKVKIDMIDRDQGSIASSSRLLERLDIIDSFRHHPVDADDYDGYGKADVVVLGALVGEGINEKTRILEKINSKMEKGALIMIRSAHSLRKILYTPVEQADVDSCGFETIVVLHPFNEVVNSILIARKV